MSSGRASTSAWRCCFLSEGAAMGATLPRVGAVRPRVGDEPCASLPGEVGPGPLHHDEHAVLEANEHEDVDEQPGQPGHQPPEPERTNLGDGGRATDRGHGAAVDVVERPSRLAL